jgi:hypothetical protein
MALLCTGSAPATGAHRDAATKAFEFICRQVEKSDDTSLYVTSVRDTQLQSKIGQYVDTFLAGWTLSELKGRVPEELEKRRADVLNKVVAKIEKNQKENGSFEGNGGWASVLSQGLASKALNGAARSGANVSAQALAKDQRQNEEGLNQANGDICPGDCRGTVERRHFSVSRSLETRRPLGEERDQSVGTEESRSSGR